MPGLQGLVLNKCPQHLIEKIWYYYYKLSNILSVLPQSVHIPGKRKQSTHQDH